MQDSLVHITDFAKRIFIIQKNHKSSPPSQRFLIVPLIRFADEPMETGIWTWIFLNRIHIKIQSLIGELFLKRNIIYRQA